MNTLIFQIELSRLKIVAFQADEVKLTDFSVYYGFLKMKSLRWLTLDMFPVRVLIKLESNFKEILLNLFVVILWAIFFCILDLWSCHCLSPQLSQSYHPPGSQAPSILWIKNTADISSISILLFVQNTKEKRCSSDNHQSL